MRFRTWIGGTQMDQQGARPTRQKRQCVDCPAIITAQGGKRRCAPCANVHYENLVRGRASRAYVPRKAVRS